MKRKFLSILLTLTMALTLLPTAAMAEGETATLQSQIATSGTVTLDKDYTEDITIPANANITLDLNGETLSNTNSGKATLSVEGTAVVKNGTISGGTGYYNIEVKAGGSLTLEDVTATAGNNGSSMIDNWGTLTITSGTYTGGLNVVKSEEGSTLMINGGKFTLNYSTSGYTGVILNYGTATITVASSFRMRQADVGITRRLLRPALWKAILLSRRLPEVHLLTISLVNLFSTVLARQLPITSRSPAETSTNQCPAAI